MLFTAWLTNDSIHLEGTRETLMKVVRDSGLYVKKVLSSTYEVFTGNDEYAGFIVGLSPYWIPDCAHEDDYWHGAFHNQHIAVYALAENVQPGSLPMRYHASNEWQEWERAKKNLETIQDQDYPPSRDCNVYPFNTVYYIRNFSWHDARTAIHKHSPCPEGALWLADNIGKSAQELWLSCPAIVWLDWLIWQAKGKYGLPTYGDWNAVTGEEWAIFEQELAGIRKLYRERKITYEEGQERMEECRVRQRVAIKRHLEFV